MGVARLGNKLRVKDAHGLPEFGDSTTLESYKAMKVFDKAIATLSDQPAEDVFEEEVDEGAEINILADL